MPTFGVSTVVIQDDTILMIQRRDFPIWALPGGGIEDRETIYKAAVRETFEETGLDVELTRLVGLYSRPNWWQVGNHVIVFAARPVGGTLRRVTDETLDARFFPLDNLPDTMSWTLSRRIKDAVNGMVGVLWMQDDVLPGNIPTRHELYRRRDAGEIVMDEFIDELCHPKAPGQVRQELKGWCVGPDKYSIEDIHVKS